MLDQYKFHQMTFTWLDGVKLNTDGGTLFGPVPKTLWSRYYPSNELNQIPTTTDPILIQYQNKNYLIDASLNLEKLTKKQQKNMGVHADGDITGSLQKLNLTPEDIDVVLMTHMHNDHAGGLTHYKNGKLKSFYSNAKIFVNAIEWEEAQNPNDRTRNTYLKENWEPIQKQVETFDQEIEIAPGMTMVHTGGHSRGHSRIRFEQEGETMLHLSDLLVTFTHTNPLWVPALDDYPMDSIAAKKEILKEAFAHKYRLLFYHDIFYRVLEYTPDGKNIQFALKNSTLSSIPMTKKQDKGPREVDKYENSFKNL